MRRGPSNGLAVPESQAEVLETTFFTRRTFGLALNHRISRSAIWQFYLE